MCNTGGLADGLSAVSTSGVIRVTGFLDIGRVYEKTKAVVRAAVVGSPRTSFSLEDIGDEDMWVQMFSSPLFAHVPIHATLNGAVEALRERERSDAEVGAVVAGPIPGTLATTADTMLARQWLVTALRDRLSEDDRQNMVDSELSERGWATDVARLSSMIIAMAMIAGAA